MHNIFTCCPLKYSPPNKRISSFSGSATILKLTLGDGGWTIFSVTSKRFASSFSISATIVSISSLNIIELSDFSFKNNVYSHI